MYIVIKTTGFTQNYMGRRNERRQHSGEKYYTVAPLSIAIAQLKEKRVDLAYYSDL